MKRVSSEDDAKLARDDWLKDGQLSGSALSKKMKDGTQSSAIWSSFQQLSTEDRDSLLKKRGTENLRHYAELTTLLTPPVSPEQQRRLANFVKRHSSFTSNQLQHDPLLRRIFLAALQDCSHIGSTYRILLQQIAKTPKLATDFQTLLRAYMTDTPCPPPLHVLYAKNALRQFLVSSYKTYPAIANILLRYPENFENDFIARIVISRTTLPTDFIKNIKSTDWQFWNTLQIILSYISTTLVDFIYTTPPIYSAIQEAIIQQAKITPPDQKNSPVNFNAFKTISAAESKKAVAVLAVEQPDIEDDWCIGEDSGLSPIRKPHNRKHSGFYSPYPQVVKARNPEEDELQFYEPPTFT